MPLLSFFRPDSRNRGGAAGVFVMALVVMAMFFVVKPGFAQTQVNLSKQGRNADFSQFTMTRPWQLVATLPATCKIGEAAFVTTASLGQQLHYCSAVNSWTMYTTTSLQAADLLDFAPLMTADSQLTVGPACSLGRPCRARLGEVTVSVMAPAVITLGGASSTGTLFVWIDQQGIRAATSAGSGTLSCNATCTVDTAFTTTFPAGTLPVGAVTYAGNVLSMVSGAMDRRSILSAQNIKPGPSANLKVTASGISGAAEVDLADTIDLAGLNATRVLKRGLAAVRPSSCQVGDLYHQTDGAAGIYLCRAANAWQGPLASVDGVAVVEARASALAATGDVAPVTLLAASHAPGTLRICGLVDVTTGAGSATLNLQLAWRSPIAGTDQTQTLLSVSVAGVIESQACRLVKTTGESAITVDPSAAGAAVYDLILTAERL